MHGDNSEVQHGLIFTRAVPPIDRSVAQMTKFESHEQVRTNNKSLFGGICVTNLARWKRGDVFAEPPSFKGRCWGPKLEQTELLLQVKETNART